MTVTELPRTLIARVHRRHDADAAPARPRATLRRGVERLKSHPGATTLPQDAALWSVHDVRFPHW